MFTIYCKKHQHNGLWCFDYFFTKDRYVLDEPLMHQASSLIDAIFLSRDTEIPENISITFDWLELPEADIVLKYTHQDYGGSVYKSSQVLDWTEEYEKEVWLCPVLTYFFKKPPDTLYAYINKEESD